MKRSRSLNVIRVIGIAVFLICSFSGCANLFMGALMSLPPTKVAFSILPANSAATLAADPDGFLDQIVQVKGKISHANGRSYVVDELICFHLKEDSPWAYEAGDEVIMKGYLKQSRRSVLSLYLKHPAAGSEHTILTNSEQGRAADTSPDRSF